MSEMTNKTIAVVANEKNEMHKSVFDDELFDDVTSYDSNELHCGIGISMEFSYYKDKGYIKKGDSICIDDCKISEVIEELESIFGKLSCHNSANDFGLSADALVYEIPDSLTREMTSEQLLVASVVPEDDAQKRSFFEKILNAPKDKDYAVLAFDWKEQRIVFYGMYRLCPIESCMQQKVIMNLSDNTYTIKHEQQRNMNTRISEEDRVHISLASLHNAVIYWLDGKRLMKVKEKCSPELVIKAGVEVVCDDTFRGNTKVTKVILPSTLKVIGKRAFEGCVNLKYVFIPEGVTEIPRDCFKGCTSLEHVVIPDGISVIGQNAFDGCTSLKTFRFPSQLRAIYDCAFMHSGLESFCPTIAEGVKCMIFAKAFAFCENLKTVTLTPGVRLACEMSFLSCTNLEEVTFTEERQGLPGAVATMLVGCDNVKNITVPYSDSGTSYNFNSTDWDISEYEHCDYNHLVSMQFSNDDIVNVITNYIDRTKVAQKPMLIWFKSNEIIDNARRAIRDILGCCEVNQHPFYGHEHFMNKDGKVERIVDHPELTNEFIYPGRYDENVRFFLYHRYTEQLDNAHIDYVKELAEITHKPLVLLVNNYSREELPEGNYTDFQQFECV